MNQQKVQVWIVNRRSEADEVLLLKVIAKRGGGWHPITGSVEKDEVKAKDWLGAAKRETEEETGLRPSAGDWVDLEFIFEFEGRFGPAQERAYAFVLHDFNGKIVLDPSEHEAMRWVSITEADKTLGFDSQRRALSAVSCYLAKR